MRSSAAPRGGGTTDRAEFQYAGVDRRIAAYLVDVLLVFAVISGIQYGLWRLTGGFPFDRLQTGLQLELWVLLSVSLPTWLYFAVSESSDRQATFGKRLFRLRVTGLADEPIGFIRALVRTIIKLIPWELAHFTVLVPVPWWSDPDPAPRLSLIVVYILLGLYLIPMFFTWQQRSVHDFLAGTVVWEPKDREPEA